MLRMFLQTRQPENNSSMKLLQVRFFPSNLERTTRSDRAGRPARFHLLSDSEHFHLRCQRNEDQYITAEAAGGWMTREYQISAPITDQEHSADQKHNQVSLVHIQIEAAAADHL